MTNTKQVKIVGKINKRAGRRPETIVLAERYDSLSFSLLTREQLDRRLAEAHS